MPPACWWCGRARRLNWKTAPCAISRRCSLPGDALVVNDTEVFPANLHGRRLGRGEHQPAIAATLVPRRLDGVALARFGLSRRSGSRSAITVRFGGKGRVCFLKQPDATVEEKGEGEQGGEVTFAFAFHGGCSTGRWPNAATCRCRPILRAAAASMSATVAITRPCSRAWKARSRCRPRDCISPKTLVSGLQQARGVASASRDAACRAGHIPAGEGRAIHPAIKCIPNGAA